MRLNAIAPIIRHTRGDDNRAARRATGHNLRAARAAIEWGMHVPHRRRTSLSLLLVGIFAGLAPDAASQAPEPTQPPPSEPPAVDQAIEEPPQPQAAVPAAEPQTGATDATAAPTEQAEQPFTLHDKVESVLAEAFPAFEDDLTVETSPEGLVEVEGTVPLLADKLAIGDTLAEIPEASVVVNRTAPAAPRRSDAAITRDVRRRLRAEADLRDFEIAVRTENQRVFLSGRLPSYPAVETALREAAGVRGVRDVIVSRLETSLP